MVWLCAASRSGRIWISPRVVSVWLIHKLLAEHVISASVLAPCYQSCGLFSMDQPPLLRLHAPDILQERQYSHWAACMKPSILSLTHVLWSGPPKLIMENYIQVFRCLCGLCLRHGPECKTVKKPCVTNCSYSCPNNVPETRIWTNSKSQLEKAKSRISKWNMLFTRPFSNSKCYHIQNIRGILVCIFTYWNKFHSMQH